MIRTSKIFLLLMPRNFLPIFYCYELLSQTCVNIDHINYFRWTIKYYKICSPSVNKDFFHAVFIKQPGSHDLSCGGREGQGGPNLPPLIPCNPGLRPFFLGFLPFALFRLRNIMQCCVIPPISPASRPFGIPTSRPFLSRLPYPSCPLFCHPQKTYINPLSSDIKKHILFTVLHTFLMTLVKRICLNIKTSYP